MPLRTHSRLRRTKSLACPRCGSTHVSSTDTVDCFYYGDDQNRVEISAVVPLRLCDACGLSFLDHVGESARHNAVCDHFGLLRPAAIRLLRRRHGLTRAQFAAATRLGEATLGRWERGATLQNAAYDQYLRLLQDDTAFRRLLAMNSMDMQPSKPPVFRALINPALLLKHQASFELVLTQVH